VRLKFWRRIVVYVVWRCGACQSGKMRQNPSRGTWSVRLKQWRSTQIQDGFWDHRSLDCSEHPFFGAMF
jgi:hypothetical protein